MKPALDVLKATMLAKQDRRRKLSRLPIVEKVRILIELQKLAVPIVSQRGIL